MPTRTARQPAQLAAPLSSTTHSSCRTHSRLVRCDPALLVDPLCSPNSLPLCSPTIRSSPSPQLAPPLCSPAALLARRAHVALLALPTSSALRHSARPPHSSFADHLARGRCSPLHARHPRLSSAHRNSPAAALARRCSPASARPAAAHARLNHHASPRRCHSKGPPKNLVPPPVFISGFDHLRFFRAAGTQVCARAGVGGTDFFHPLQASR